MTLLATALVDFSALWKIVLAALICGSGVTVAFSFALIGSSRVANAETATAKLAGYSLTAIAGAFCVGAVAFGLVTMIHKS